MATQARGNGGGFNRGAVGRTEGGVKRDDRVYKTESTVVVNYSSNDQLTATAVIKEIEEVCGEGSVYACVPKPGNSYEVTVADRSCVQIVLDGVKIGDRMLECREVVQTSMVVSFMHLSAYVEDAEIINKLTDMNVEILDVIKRHYYKGTDVADGTRFVRVKLPPNVKSLPYSMKFFNGKTYEFAKVLHNNQIRVCSECLADDHLYRQCPKFICHRCGGQGHTKRLCKAQLCPLCREFACVCKQYNYTSRCRKCDEIDCVCNMEIELCGNCRKTEEECKCIPDNVCKSCGEGSAYCECDKLVCYTCGQFSCQCSRTDWWDNEVTDIPVTSTHETLVKTTPVQVEPSKKTVASDTSTKENSAQLTHASEGQTQRKEANITEETSQKIVTSPKERQKPDCSTNVSKGGSKEGKQTEDILSNQGGVSRSESGAAQSDKTANVTHDGINDTPNCDMTIENDDILSDDDQSQMDCTNVLKRRRRLVNYDSMNPYSNKNQRVGHNAK